MLSPAVEPQDEFRAQLEGRISRYAAQRDDVQTKLVELNHALNSLDKRLEAAIEMYRLEFGVDPEAAKAVRPAQGEGARRRQHRDGSSWNVVVARVLAEAGSPLHLNDIWHRMEQAGFETASKDPLRSLASVLVRHPDVYRTGRNIYALKSISAQAQESLEGLAAGEVVPAQGEAA
jgi:hypothetical protein